MEHIINSTLKKDEKIENNFHVNELAKVAAMMKLNNSSQGEFMDSLYDLSSDYDKVMDESNQLKKSIIDISDKTIDLIKKSQYLNEIHQQFDQEISEREQTDSLQNRLETIEYLKRKSHEYQVQVSGMQQQLNEAFALSNNLDVQQTTLIEIYDRIQELKTEIEPKLKLIERYHNLPPDVAQTRTRILQAKEQLKHLEEVFNRKAQHIWFD
ncbi:predicted protein [Naegleria gruberi]|uniref:Predicted protein n=1 Tax=Naegleria gruberi TaxID=5762 RepID=D2UZ03_NAEGR|nr:uncharacterized protein NAEGRDRAFT_45359 [Naegleria gruberi]EFC50064.1 predicted protein [Naegleria gruberi]|eukprot:XP_002682808.1 predicted protein [Naegleria gruberi strain NEG-M]